MREAKEQDSGQKIHSPFRTQLIHPHESGPVYEILYQKYLEPYFSNTGAGTLPSAGVYLSEVTYPHIALLLYEDLFVTQSILAHELTHFFTSAYSMPRWLDEGLASIVEDEVLGFSTCKFDPGRLIEHRGYWTSVRLATFWSGEIFGDVNARHELVYQLADILVRNLIRLDKERFQKFIREADVADGGLKTADQVLSIKLDDLVHEILREGFPFKI